MKTISTLFLLVFPFYSFVCNSPENNLQLKVLNPNSFSADDYYLEFETEDLDHEFIIKDGAQLVPFQVEKKESDKLKVGIVISLKPNEEKLLIVEYGTKIKKPEFTNRTYAELAMKPGNVYFDGRFRGNKFENVTKLKVPSIHTDHDALFKYEGPGWESEKVGYRFYLDWRNAIDIFGKKKNQLVLAKVGVHDTVAKDDSYHTMQDWGMDIFKVGNSLGIGSFGLWYDGKVNMVSKTDSIFCEITANGPIRSEIKTKYCGWKVGNKKYDLESELLITAGSRITKSELSISGDASNIVTGLAKFAGTQFFKNDTPGEWSYIALYGNQTLVSDSDQLGIALIYRTEDLIELDEDELSYLLKLAPKQQKIEYYFCAAWEQEENGVKSIDEFKTYLRKCIMLLNNPIIVELN